MTTEQPMLETTISGEKFDKPRYLIPCLVVDRYGKWRLENRPPLPDAIPPQFQWSSELESACKAYRKKGEKAR